MQLRNGLWQPVAQPDQEEHPETRHCKEEYPSIAKNRGRDAPYGWIQWKGTDVCMDVHCTCGESMHVDADFLYHIKCSHCGQVYECSGYIDLIPLDFEPDGTVTLEGE